MILGFSFKQVMKLSNLKRWAIIEMSREQSVAEHSYNVAMIGMALVDDIKSRYPGDFNKLMGKVVYWALVHDLPELVTGDLPTPIKNNIGGRVDDMEKKLFPEYMYEKASIDSIALGITKAADLVDAIQFATKFCVDADRSEIILEMQLRLDDHCESFDMEHGMSLKRSVSNIWLS